MWEHFTSWKRTKTLVKAYHGLIAIRIFRLLQRAGIYENIKDKERRKTDGGKL